MTSSPHAPIVASYLRLATLALAATLLPCAATPLLSEESGDTPPAEDRWTPAVSMRYLQVSGVAISPDGSRIAYVVREPLMEGEKSEYRSHIWVADANGGRNLQFTRGESPASGPAFSPDGRWLAFHVTSFDWAPDGQRLVFGHQSDPRINTGRLSGDIAVVGASGGEVTQLVTGPGIESSPRSSPDGEMIAYASTGDRPEPIGLADLYVVDPGTGESRMLPETPNRSVSILGWSAGSDEVFLNESLGTTRHLIAVPVGGGQIRQVKEFRYANYMDWGYGDLSDLLAGVDEVIDMGVAHPDSLLLMGWSYGGYMTSFAVTQTDRFRAASMGAGLPNLISMVTTTDIGDYLVGHMGEEYFDNYEAYEKHSAIYDISKVTTPTQVIHGAQDLRVPFTQGQEFFNSLRRLGVETEMVVYPRMPHGPREPKFLMVVSERILTWFEKHLRPAKPAADR